MWNVPNESPGSLFWLRVPEKQVSLPFRFYKGKPRRFPQLHVTVWHVGQFLNLSGSHAAQDRVSPREPCEELSAVQRASNPPDAVGPRSRGFK